SPLLPPLRREDAQGPPFRGCHALRHLRLPFRWLPARFVLDGPGRSLRGSSGRPSYPPTSPDISNRPVHAQGQEPGPTVAAFAGTREVRGAVPRSGERGYSAQKKVGDSFPQEQPSWLWFATRCRATDVVGGIE